MKHHRRAEPVIKDLFKERISVSLFAGCGGACVGMRAATGNEVDVAINHDKVAIAVHRQNHPTTEHRISDVFEVKRKRLYLVARCDGEPIVKPPPYPKTLEAA